MFCRYCGKEIEDGAKFCKYCGKSQTDEQKPDNKTAPDPMQDYQKTRLNARILETIRKEFHVDPEKELKNFTSFHSQSYWWPTAGVVVCAVLSLILSPLFFIALLAFFVWLIILIVRIFRSAFGITETRLLARIWPSLTFDIPLDQIVKVDVANLIRSGVCGDLLVTTKETTYTFKSVSNVKNFKKTLDQYLT